MRKMLTMAAAMAVALPVSLAGAARPLTPPGQLTPKKNDPAKVCKPAKHKGVTYIMRGVLVRDATATEMLVDVTSVNKHGKRALAGPTARGGGMYSVPMLTVKLDACTHVSRRGKGPSKRSYTSLTAGDRVVVAWSAKRGTAFVDLGAARRVVDQGKKS